MMGERIRPDQKDKIKVVLHGLMNGKDREGLAQELGYANHRSLDMLMRRTGYIWDRQRQMYRQPGEPPRAIPGVQSPAVDSKVAKALLLFTQGMDARQVAEKAGFVDNREMAAYMKGMGYAWDTAQNNYIPSSERGPAPASAANQSWQPRQPAQVVSCEERGEIPSWQQYLPSLKWLERNMEDLNDVLAKTDERQECVGVIPRYAVPGVFITKSVHMSNQLDQMVREFSTTRNISQRDIFATALLEFCRKYGYKHEVESLLSVN